MGVPIRLIRTDGEKIPLMAESITMTVDRSVGSMPIPWTGGKRIGLDLNRAKAAIVITGILTDDGREQTTSGQASFCSIDFARTTGNKTWYSAAPLVLNAVPYFNKDIMLLDKNGDTHTFRLTNQASVGTIASTGSGNTIVSVGVGNASNAAAVAAALVLGIQSTAHPSAVGSPKPGNFFTGSAIASERDPTQGNCKVKIVQDFNGYYGGRGPAFGGWNRGSYIAGPRDTPHSTRWDLGSADVGPKSAGDKAMDLYGSFNNMNNSNADLTEFGGGGSRDLFDTYEENVAQDDAKRGDYIIGIQIPYNSMVKGTNGDYAQRNFFMPTGRHRNKLEKGSEANNEPVDVDFRQWDHGSYKGIKGTVQQFVITYDAGETVYNYQLTFLPIDEII